MREKQPSSDAMKAVMSGVKSDSRKKYPWDTLTIGESFGVLHSEMKLKTLTNYANRVGIKLGRRFHIIDHGEANGYEVGYIGERKEKGPWDKSSDKTHVTKLATIEEPTGEERFKNMGFKT
jgi:hypothetical protein